MNEIKENIKNKDTSFDFSNKYVILNNGIKMPIIGLGTWTFTNEEAEEAVYIAIKNGYRLIDTAQYYGDEIGVGKGVRKAIEEGIVKREDIFVTSKIYASTDHNKAIEKSLNNLDLDYIDLLLIHQPGFDDKGLYQTMEKYYKEGKLKAIGISNYYTKEAIDEVLSYAEIVPAVIQNENHIYYQNNELQEYVKQYGIIIESWYPFGGRGHTSENFNNEVIKELAEKYNKTSAQIILRWQLQAGYIAIPGSRNPDHIKENISIFDFELSDEDMKKIYNINENRRYENW
ncbi:MAG: aldo/keto reductase [Bacilli bacterium]|nr:aldo/keto reductase [Bacilli bacterium]